MSTFNWAIGAGFYLPASETRISPFGINDDLSTHFAVQIDVTADDVAPNNATYVAQWGNDDTGNGSRMRPFRTIKRGLARYFDNGAANRIIIGSGVYKEDFDNTAFNTILYGDGNVEIDVSYIMSNFDRLRGAYNINFFKGDWVGGAYVGADNLYMNCTFRGCTFLNTGRKLIARNCTFIDCVDLNLGTEYISNGASGNRNNTFINCNFTKNDIAAHLNSRQTWDCIFQNCSITLLTSSAFENCLFDGVTFKIGTREAKVYATLAELRADMVSEFGEVPYNFARCYFSPPNFNAPERGDYTLQIGSPSANMAFNGTYVGAHSFAKCQKPSEGNTGMIDSSLNFTVVADGLEQTVNTLDSEVVFRPILNTEGREISGFRVGYDNAPGSGSYVDTTDDLDSTIISFGGAVEANQPYFVKKGNAIYQGVTYVTGQRFTTGSATSITLTIDDEVQKIVEAPSRWNLSARVSNGTLLNGGYTLKVGAWYHVRSGSITFNGTDYQKDEVFKAAVAAGFTGAGQLVEIFDGEAYHLFEINKKPTTNNVGNLLSGAIVRGNGHQDFDRTAANVFPMYHKYIQFKVQVKANNLRNI